MSSYRPAHSLGTIHNVPMISYPLCKRTTYFPPSQQPSQFLSQRLQAQALVSRENPTRIKRLSVLSDVLQFACRHRRLLSYTQTVAKTNLPSYFTLIQNGHATVGRARQDETDSIFRLIELPHGYLLSFKRHEGSAVSRFGTSFPIGRV